MYTLPPCRQAPERTYGATVRTQSVRPQHGFATLQTHLEGMRIVNDSFFT